MSDEESDREAPVVAKKGVWPQNSLEAHIALHIRAVRLSSSVYLCSGEMLINPSRGLPVSAKARLSLQIFPEYEYLPDYFAVV